MTGGRGGGGCKPSRSNKVTQETANFTPVNGEVFSRDKYESWRNGKLKMRWHEMIPTMRHLGYTVDKAMKSELREIDKKNARKFNCVEEQKGEEKDYFAEVMHGEKKYKDNEAEDHSHDEDDRVAVAAAANARLSRKKTDMKEKKSDKNSKKKKTRKRTPSPIVFSSSESESYSDESESSDTDSTHSSESTSDSEN